MARHSTGVLITVELFLANQHTFVVEVIIRVPVFAALLATVMLATGLSLLTDSLADKRITTFIELPTFCFSA